MEIVKGLEAKIEAGKIVLSYDIKSLIGPKIAELKAKVDSGELDLIKGTSLDNMALIAVLDAVEHELSK